MPEPADDIEACWECYREWMSVLRLDVANRLVPAMNAAAVTLELRGNLWEMIRSLQAGVAPGESEWAHVEEHLRMEDELLKLISDSARAGYSVVAENLYEMREKFPRTGFDWRARRAEAERRVEEIPPK